jgi:hypothetical protein
VQNGRSFASTAGGAHNITRALQVPAEDIYSRPEIWSLDLDNEHDKLTVFRMLQKEG